MCAVAGFSDSWACGCTLTAVYNNDVFVAAYWDGCELVYEAYLVCTTVCDCADRFGGVLSGQKPSLFPTDNIGIEFTNSSW